MNMTNQYKILALDLDGTLLDAQSRITPENARAVRMAQQAGVQIVLCTGRNVREVRPTYTVTDETSSGAPAATCARCAASANSWKPHRTGSSPQTVRQCSIRTTGNRHFSTV